MRKLIVAVVSVCALLLGSTAGLAQQPLPAFPGAEGFGSLTPGGRGGDVYVVSTLNNAGPGSLRECIEASGPRTCVFSVGGTITLTEQYRIENPFLTIAGQTAPGGGITVRNANGNTDMAFRIQTNDVVLRFLTVRPGDGGASSSSLRAISVWHRDGLAHDVIVDHASTSWTPDEIISTWYTAHNVTYQWMMVYEGLECSTHSDGCPHSKGPLFGSDGAHSIAMHHSVMAHNGDRNPVVKIEGVVDLVNNIVYNPDFSPSKIEADFGPALGNFVGNFYKPGEASSDTYNLKIQNDGGGGADVYVRGNIGPARFNNTLPEDLAVESEFTVWQKPTPHSTPSVTTYGCNSNTPGDCAMFDIVTADAGNSRGLTCEGDWYYRRDAHDERIINDIINGTGSIIDHPSEVGGWLNIQGGPACSDTDQDGMPDVWETANNLNPNDPADRNLLDVSGYTMLEMYLNGDEVVDPPPPPPSDRDGDGIPDDEDECPDDPTNTCNDPPPPPPDSDGDGIPDDEDECPHDPTNTCNDPIPPLPPDTLTVVSEPDSFLVHSMWNDNSEDETGFELQRRVQSSAVWNLLALLDPNTVEYDDTAVELNTYCYRVRSFNDVLASEFTPEACVEVTETPDPPPPPTTPAAPSDLVASILNNGKVMLTWVDNSNNETGFPVEAQNDDGSWSLLRILPDNKEVYRPNRLTAGMQYCFRVSAVNDEGTSDPSNVACNIPSR
jgi:hypothetical protein